MRLARKIIKLKRWGEKLERAVWKMYILKQCCHNTWKSWKTRKNWVFQNFTRKNPTLKTLYFSGKCC